MIHGSQRATPDEGPSLSLRWFVSGHPDSYLGGGRLRFGRLPSAVGPDERDGSTRRDRIRMEGPGDVRTDPPGILPSGRGRGWGLVSSCLEPLDGVFGATGGSRRRRRDGRRGVVGRWR